MKWIPTVLQVQPTSAHPPALHRPSSKPEPTPPTKHGTAAKDVATTLPQGFHREFAPSGLGRRGQFAPVRAHGGEEGESGGRTGQRNVITDLARANRRPQTGTPNDAV